MRFIMHKRIIVCLTVAVLMLLGSIHSQETRNVAKIGYFEGGPYFLHKAVYRELKDDLERMKDDGIEIIFEPYAYKSADWKRDKCKAMAGDLVRLKDIDIVIAAGPWVIEDLLEAGFDRTIVGIHQFDPEAQGLVDSSGQSLHPDLTVNYRPNKIKTDMASLQKLFPSREVGLVYFPSGDEAPEIRDRFYRAAGEHGAVIYSAQGFSRDGLYSFFASFDEIRKKIDVLYVPPLWGMELDQMRQFFRETQYAHVPTFSSEGFLMVEKGATASNCIYPYRTMAKFTAYKILKIINGETPSSLPTIFDDTQALCLNLEAGNSLRVVFSRNNINNARTIPALPGDTIDHYTFSDAIDQGVRENASLLIAGELHRKAVAEARRAYASFFPHLNLSVSAAAADNEAEAAKYNRVLNREFSADIILDQKVLSFPAIKAIQIAEKSRAIEEASLRKATSDLRHVITIAYLTVLENEEKLEKYTETVDRLRDYWETAVTNHRLGITDTLDVPLLEERLVAAKIELFDARSELKVARVILNVLLNRPGDRNIVLSSEEFSPEIMVTIAQKFDKYTSDAKKQEKFEQYLIEKGIGNSADMEIASLSIGIQHDLISKHRNRFLPELSLRAKYSYADEFEPVLSDRKESWTIGGILSIPILSGPEWKYNGKILDAQLEKSLYQRDVIRFAKSQDILAKADYFVTRVSTLPMNYFVRNLSTANLESAYEKYDGGRLSVIDLISLERNVTEAETDLIRDKYQFFMSYAELLRAIEVDYLIHASPEEAEFHRNLEEYMAQ